MLSILNRDWLQVLRGQMYLVEFDKLRPLFIKTSASNTTLATSTAADVTPATTAAAASNSVSGEAVHLQTGVVASVSDSSSQPFEVVCNDEATTREDETELPLDDPTSNRDQVCISLSRVDYFMVLL